MTYPLGDEVLDLRMQCALDTAELARLRRNLQATHQALLDARAELERTGPVAAAAHAYCAAWDSDDGAARFLHSDLLAAHRATTPSATPSTHVIVAVDELNGLRTRYDRLWDLFVDATGYEPSDAELGGVS